MNKRANEGMKEWKSWRTNERFHEKMNVRLNYSITPKAYIREQLKIVMAYNISLLLNKEYTE